MWTLVSAAELLPSKALAKPTPPRVQWRGLGCKRGRMPSASWDLGLGRRWRRSLACAGLLAALGAIAAAAQSSEPASVIIVLDSSGSMAGNIEGMRTSKVVLARDAVRRALGRVPTADPRRACHLRPSTRRLRRRRDRASARAGRCTADRRYTGKDQPTGARTADAGAARGRQVIRAGSGRRSLVLIHDDADNCQQNVCVVAEELARALASPPTSSASGLKPDDVNRMACLPQATGGRLFNARSAEQITHRDRGGA